MRFCLLLGALLGVSILSAYGHAAPSDEAPPVAAECERDLVEPTGLSTNWALSPADFDAMVLAYPDLADDLRFFARMAHFVDDPANAEFFDLLGAYSGVGLAANYYENEVDYVANDDEHREDQVRVIADFAQSMGLYPAHYGEEEYTFLARALGGLPVQASFDYERLFDYTGMVMKLRDYYLKKRPQGVPTMREFALQSREAQSAFVDQAARADHSARHDVDALTEKFGRRLLGRRVFEFPHETKLLNRVERALDGDAVELLELNNVETKKLTPRKLRETAAKIAPLQFSLGTMLLLKRFGAFMGSMLAATDQKYVLQSPIMVVVAFQKALEQDTFVDQGHAPFLRRALAEVILAAPTMSGPEAHRKVRTRLAKLFRDLNTSWREIQREHARTTTKPISPAPESSGDDGPSREERIRQHGEQARVRAMLPTAGKTGPKRASSLGIEPARANDVRPAPLWDDLLGKANQGRSIDEARALFARTTPADTVLPLHIRRTGFTYRVELSADLVHQMLHPEPGEPEDLRVWLKALAHGPAREQRQNGWKKLALPIGIYSWEIKVVSSLYRILGYKTNEGTWRFEKIDLLH